MVFREVVRKKNVLSQEECVSILKSELRGVLSVIGDGGYPYGIPLNHFYDERDGRLYFHSGPTGHKIDAISACDKASYCVYDKGYRRDGEWALNIKSVIVFGRVSIVEDKARAIDICRRLSQKFTSDTRYIEEEIAGHGERVVVFELTPEHMTGKTVNEA